MPSEKKDNRAKETADKAIVASVTAEMAQPRVAVSVNAQADEQGQGRHGKTARHHAKGAAKDHLEQYGTGTPISKSES